MKFNDIKFNETHLVKNNKDLNIKSKTDLDIRKQHRVRRLY